MAEAYIVEYLAHPPGGWPGPHWRSYADCWWQVSPHRTYTRLETAMRVMRDHARSLAWNGLDGADARGLAFRGHWSRVVTTDGRIIAEQEHSQGHLRRNVFIVDLFFYGDKTPGDCCGDEFDDEFEAIDAGYEMMRLQPDRITGFSIRRLEDW